MLLLVLLVLAIIIAFVIFKVNPQQNVIEMKTNQWVDAVTKTNDPNVIFNTFCADGILLGTLSEKIKVGEEIKKYFEYFAKLPNLKVTSIQHNVSKVTDNVYVNNAMVHWLFGDRKEPLVARMTFIFRKTAGKWCIFELHSSELPEPKK